MAWRELRLLTVFFVVASSARLSEIFQRLRSCLNLLLYWLREATWRKHPCTPGPQLLFGSETSGKPVTWVMTRDEAQL